VKHLWILGIFVVGVVVAVVVLRRNALPDTIHVGGRDYIQPTGCMRPYARDLPLRRIGSIGTRPLYRPNHMPKGLVPVYLYVRSGGCLHAYGLSGGP
jgi:hypothetical protein